MRPMLQQTPIPDQDFRRRFLIVLMLSGVGFTGLFELAAVLGAVPLTRFHFVANLGYMLTTAAMTVALLRHPGWLTAIAWLEAANSFLIFLSALYNVPDDEMRYIWFVLQVGGTFLLLGSAAGWLTTLAIVVIVVASRAGGMIDLSVNGIATFCIGLPCTGVLFHSFSSQIQNYIGKLQAANRMVEFAASHDALTGLLNRAAFTEVSDRLMTIAKVRQSPLSLLFIDVDRFKSINDHYGHAGGDQALVSIATTIERSVRPADLVARIGGEEIVVILPETDESDALKVAERLRSEVEMACPQINGAAVGLTVSIGCATTSAPDYSVEQLLHRADEAMYRAKRKGRNRVETALGESRRENGAFDEKTPFPDQAIAVA